MKRWRGPLLTMLATAVLANLAILAWAPRLVSARASGQIVERALQFGADLPAELQRQPAIAALARDIRARGGRNVAVPAPRATAASRTVVRPSPDLLYTVCVFDLATAPLRVKAPVQDSYVSVAGFADNTDNFFAVNDLQVEAGADGRRRFDFVVAREGQDIPPGTERARVIRSPSAHGVVLFRSLIVEDAGFEALRRDYQFQQRCTPL